METGAGQVVLMIGRGDLPGDLLRWIKRVRDSSGDAKPTRGAREIDEIAADAQRAPLSPPPGIEVEEGPPIVYRYRSQEPVSRWPVIVPFIAWLCLVLYEAPALGLPWAYVAACAVPLALGLVYWALRSGPFTVVLRLGEGIAGAIGTVEDRRSGFRLKSIAYAATSSMGLYLPALPFAASWLPDLGDEPETQRVEGRTWSPLVHVPERFFAGFASPIAGGPGVAELAWLAAAVQSLNSSAEARQIAGRRRAGRPRRLLAGTVRIDRASIVGRGVNKWVSRHLT